MLFPNGAIQFLAKYQRRFRRKKKALSALTKDDIDRQNGAEINRVWREINELLDKEEMWWQQRSMVQ